MPRMEATSALVLPCASQSSAFRRARRQPQLQTMVRSRKNPVLNSRFTCCAERRKPRLDRADEIGIGHRLRQVIIGAKIHPAADVIFLSFRGQKK